MYIFLVSCDCSLFFFFFFFFFFVLMFFLVYCLVVGLVGPAWHNHIIEEEGPGCFVFYGLWRMWCPSWFLLHFLFVSLVGCIL